MVRVTETLRIDAPPERVAALYADVSGWARLFPATIRGARVVRSSPEEQVIEVDHVEGRVVNLLRPKSPTCFELEEFKRHFDATFRNTFEPEGERTRYTLEAQIRLRGPLRLLGLVLKPMIRSRMRRFVLLPMKRAAERSQA